MRQRAKMRPSPIRRVLGTVGWLAWVGLFAAGGSAAGWLGRNEVAREVITNISADPKETFTKDSMNILLLGCDEDLAPGGQKVLKQAGRADMILIAHLDFAKKTISGVSIPRDTRVQLPGGPPHKVNAFHALAKPEKANAFQQQAVEHLTGVKIDRTVQIDYPAFQELIDSVGGVEVMVKHRMDYQDKAGGLYVDFKPGRRKLDGYDAMCYVRYRKTTPKTKLNPKGGEGDPKAEGDFARTERQRQLLLAFKGQVIKNWTSLPEIIEKGVDVLGGALTPKEIAALSSFSRGVSQSSIKMMRLPTKPGRGTFEELDRKPALAMLKQFGFISAGAKTSANEEDEQ